MHCTGSVLTSPAFELAIDLLVVTITFTLDHPIDGANWYSDQPADPDGCQISARDESTDGLFGYPQDFGRFSDS
jgi:hypothetical protein